MEVTSTKSGSVCTFMIEGRIDTLTAPELEKKVKAQLPDCNKMVFDFRNVKYISSAGIRVLVSAQRELMKKGGVVVTGINANIEKVFTMTGMYKVLTIK